MESSIAVFLARWIACVHPPTNIGAKLRQEPQVDSETLSSTIQPTIRSLECFRWCSESVEKTSPILPRVQLLACVNARRCLFTQRVCCSWQSARPGQHSRALEQAQSDICPTKNHCDMQVPSWRHISCHTDKNRYYT